MVNGISPLRRRSSWVRSKLGVLDGGLGTEKSSGFIENEITEGDGNDVVGRWGPDGGKWNG